jgi:teichoic acid transport system permease protein
MAVALRSEKRRPDDIPADLQQIGRVKPLIPYLKDMWARRDFIVAVPLGQLRAQNQNTLFGSFWHLLNPVLLAGVYYLIFGVLFPLNSQEFDNFAGYLVTGIFGFTYLNKGIMAGTRTVTTNMALIQQINFPRAALPVSAVIVETVAQGPAVIALMVLVVITGTVPSLTWFLIIPVLLIQSVFLLGCCFFVARATFHFRDTEQLLPYMLRIWMYVSGLFFPLTYVITAGQERNIEWIVTLFQWNPAWLFMALWRGAMVGDIGPPLHQTPLWYWGAASLWAVVALVGGFIFFRANESEYSRGL